MVSLWRSENPRWERWSASRSSELVENWHNGQRQLATQIYPLSGIEVMTGTMVKRVIVQKQAEKKVATGVELANGTVIASEASNRLIWKLQDAPGLDAFGYWSQGGA